MEKIIVLFIALLMSLPHASAQNTEASLPDNASVCSESRSRQLDFSASTNIQKIDILYKNNCAEPRWDYAENQKALEILTQVILQLSSEQSNIRTIVIEGAASPVGSEKYNNKLSLRRATLLRDAISKMEGGSSTPYSCNIHRRELERVQGVRIQRLPLGKPRRCSRHHSEQWHLT